MSICLQKDIDYKCMKCYVLGMGTIVIGSLCFLQRSFMSRKRRIWYPGAIYHVMSRGNRRTVIFREKSDYFEFMKYLRFVKGIYPFKIHSICLMTNHFHMLIETEEVNLSKIMQKLLTLYANDFNKRYKLNGHLFESRYTACLVEDESYFLEVSRYIHLNPVKAYLVGNPADYEYSSYNCYMSGIPGFRVEKGIRMHKLISGIVTTERILGYYRNNGSELYRKFVESRMPHTEQEQMIQKDIREDDMWLPK